MLHLYEARTFFISFRPGKVLLTQTGIAYSRRNISHIYTSSWDEKRPTLLNFPFKDVLVSLTFLRSSQPELLEERLSQSFERIKIPAHKFKAGNEKSYQNWSFPVRLFENSPDMAFSIQSRLLYKQPLIFSKLKISPFTCS